jgi:hypothetical protein
MTEDCAELYEKFMKECTFYSNEDIEDTAIDFRRWLKRRALKKEEDTAIDFRRW